ncbi:hypothetical protein JCM14469_26730 [Desulfatiferula olefinivorans]
MKKTKNTSLKATAKSLNMEHKSLIDSLLRDELLIRIDGKLEPRAKAIIKGYFTLETGTFGRIKNRVRVTHEGWHMIADSYCSELREV